MPAQDADIRALVEEITRLDRAIAQPQPDETMNALLAARADATERLVAAPVVALDDLILKLDVLCQRLHEDLAPYDRGAQLNARLARATFDAARQLQNGER